MAGTNSVEREEAALVQRLPAPLAPLTRLAYNYWWSWQCDGARLFEALDVQHWERCGRNPVRLLHEVALPVLERAAEDRALIELANQLEHRLSLVCAAPATSHPVISSERPCVFFCAEYAIHVSLPIYSGGLGVLAGDFLKEASDCALPLCAVGLLYRQGYFHQRLDLAGWQHESWVSATPEQLPMVRVTQANGLPMRVEIPIRGRSVFAHIWKVQVGRVPLYLLDTSLPENVPIDRWITSRLYIGDRQFRLLQYAVLGVGGVRALRALGIEPAVIHLNEGHAALAALELAKGLSGFENLGQALQAARERIVFTTHTPVAAGNETYSSHEIAQALKSLPEHFGIDARELLELGRASAGSEPEFGMTNLALRASRSANAVSRRHGEVARAMWQPLWPERAIADVPISHVTNGVHVATWIAEPMRELLERYLGADFLAHARDAARWSGIDSIPDEELWAVRNELRSNLVTRVRERSVIDRLSRGEAIDYVESAASTFNADTLTIGFARRIASYKRLQLLVRDSARALALLAGPRPIQVVIAGKAHPRDEQAKQLVQTVFGLKTSAGSRVVFLEDYDLALAAELVAGCDLWVNLPRPPLEASGTSGMKAALNGCLNLSVLDGWWIEGYDGNNGWAIDSDAGVDPDTQDGRDAEALYSLLEREVIPSFYQRENGLPREWLRRVKASLRSLPPKFSMNRALRDYCEGIYA